MLGLKRFQWISFMVVGIFILGACGNEEVDTATSIEMDVEEQDEEVDNDSVTEDTTVEEQDTTGEQNTTAEENAAAERNTDAEDNTDEERVYQDYIDMPIMYPDGTMGAISDFEGKFILLNFFGEWCKYCVAEMPDLNEFYMNYEEDDFVILVMDVLPLERDFGADHERVYEWYQNEGYTMPMVFDTDGQIAATYSVTSYPTSYFINKEGKVLGGISGAIDGPFIQEVLDTYKDK